MRDTDLLINGGYFVFRKDIFQYIKEGEELVAEPFHRLMQENRLLGYRTTSSGIAWTPSRNSRS